MTTESLNVQITLENDEYLKGLKEVVKATTKSMDQVREEIRLKIGLDDSGLNKSTKKISEGLSSVDTGVEEVAKSVEEMSECFDSISFNGIDLTEFQNEINGLLSNFDILRDYLAELEATYSANYNFLPDDMYSTIDDYRDYIDNNIGSISEDIDYTIDLISKKIGLSSDALKAYLISNYTEVARLYGIEMENANDRAKLSSPKASSNKPDLDLGKIVKTFAKALLGVRGLYMLIRKIITNNEKITTAVSNLTGTISNWLEPVLNALANVINFIASLISKIFKVNLGTKKSSEETAKNTAPFDEINNMSENNSNSEASLKTEWGELSSAEKLLTILLGIYAIVKVIKFINFISDIKKVTEALTPLFEGIKEFFTGTAWASVLGVVSVIAGIYLAVKSFIDMWNEGFSWVKEAIMVVGIALAAVGAVLLGVAAAPAAIVAAIVAALATIAIVVHDNWDAICSWATQAWEDIKNWFKGIWDSIVEWWNGVKQWWSELKQAWNNLMSALGTSIKESLQQDWNNIKNLFTNIKSGAVELFNNLKTRVSSFFENIKSTVSSKVKSIINTYIINPINKVISWINSKLHFSYNGLSIAGRQIIPAFSTTLFQLGTIPQLATGTNYVAADGLAYLHEGEAVVPKKYNDNNVETNNLLRQLINVVDSKEFKAYISQKEIGKSAVNYINSQSRIYGGSLV